MNSTGFKVGDRVKVVDTYHDQGNYKNGDIGIIIDICNRLFSVKINGKKALIYESEIELVEKPT